ncbi:MAG: BamA/TamA family outer membrane protein [Gammaproteobacteria bacterium]|nr:BamA/TamA family outer membrane protein [Gammaproteobacteria bacterium]
MMNRVPARLFRVVALKLLLFCVVLNAAAAERPRIGLALSGGGARGAAHIGVLKELEALQVPIDYIAGTSMGSIIGGLYASGMSPEEIEAEMNAMDWDAVLQDDIERPRRNFRSKREDQLGLSNIRVGVKDGVNVGTALIQAQRLNLELRRMTQRVSEVTDFDKLPIPFRAVATDIVTGGEVVLSHGDLARSIRASMTVPGVFSGVEIEGRLLVDGGLVNNLPVSVVREMGADVVIAVDISTPLLKREELGSALGVVGQLAGLLTRGNTEKQIASLTEKDLLIIPDLGNISSADFSKSTEANIRGRQAAVEKKDRLSGFAAFNPNNQPLRKLPYKSSSGVAFIRIESDSILDEAIFINALGVKVGDPVDVQKIEEGVGRVYDLGIFQQVDYQLVEERGKTGILLRSQEKSWGTDNLRFGLQLGSDTGHGGSFFNASAAYTMVPFNSKMGQWRTFLQMGHEPALTTDLYQHLDDELHYFIRGGLFYITKRFELASDKNMISEFRQAQLGAELWAGRELGDWGRLELGLRRYAGEVDQAIGENFLIGEKVQTGQMVSAFRLDTLDNIFFPREGNYASLAWRASRESLGADGDYNQLELTLGGAKSWGKHTAIGMLDFNTSEDGLPLEDHYFLGGFRRLSGLRQNQLVGPNAGLGVVGYLYEIYHSNYFPVYAGGTLEVGNVWREQSDISLNDTIFAGSLMLGADTPIGPLFFAYGHAQGGQKGIYFYLQHPWY